MSKKSSLTNDVHSEKTVPELIFVTERDLPLSCPRPGQTVWSLHPTVYLPVSGEKVTVCPYCSARYQLSSQ